MYHDGNICYGTSSDREVTLLYKTPIYYIDIFKDKICKEVTLIKNFDFNSFLMENGLDSYIKSVYNKEQLKTIMDKIYQKQKDEIDE